jgi:hypothetical protein
MDDLVEQLAALDVVETLRRENRMPLPDARLVVEFDRLACRVMNQRTTGNPDYRRIRNSLGLKSTVG